MTCVRTTSTKMTNPSANSLAGRRTVLACTKIVKVVSGFYWDGKSTWWIDGILTEKARQCEEEDRLVHKEGGAQDDGPSLGRPRWRPVDGHRG